MPIPRFETSEFFINTTEDDNDEQYELYNDYVPDSNHDRHLYTILQQFMTIVNTNDDMEVNEYCIQSMPSVCETVYNKFTSTSDCSISVDELEDIVNNIIHCSFMYAARVLVDMTQIAKYIRFLNKCMVELFSVA